MFEKDFLSISLGNKHIKTVCGHHKAGKLVIKGASMVPTPAGAMQNGYIIDKAAVANLIENEMSRQNCRVKGLIFTVGGTNVITRDIQLPRSTEAEVQKILSFDAEQFFPIKLTDYVFDYKLLEDMTVEAKDITRVMLVALPEKLADDYMDLASILDNQVRALDIQPDCIAKLFDHHHIQWKNDEDQGVTKDIAVIDLGHGSVNVSIFSKGIIRFNRMLPYGLQDMHNAVMQKLNVDAVTADRYIMSELNMSDAGGPQADGVTSAAGKLVTRILQDVSRLFDFYRSNNFIKTGFKIYLCGGGSSIKGIDQLTGRFFNTGVEIIGRTSPLANIQANSDKGGSELMNQLNCYVAELGALCR